MTPDGHEVVRRAVVSARVTSLRDAARYARAARDALDAGQVSTAVRAYGNAMRDLHFTRGLFRRPDATATLSRVIGSLGFRLSVAVARLEVRS